MQTIDGILVYGNLESQEALDQMKRCAVGAYKTAMMADHHLGYSMPIGGVVAYENKISPSGVGYDIGCGNKAVCLDIPYNDVLLNIKKIMDDIVKNISFGVGRSNNDQIQDHPLFDKDGHDAWNIPFIKEIKRKAACQLGTVGSGNHYIDIFYDAQMRIWIGCHFGSRGLGHTIASTFLKLGGGIDAIHAEPTVFDVDSDLGAQYLSAMDLAGKYAYAGRDYVCDKVAGILGAKIIDSVHNHHNFAWKEIHDGKELWVVRKGATPNFPGQRGFVGGSMGDISVILRGLDTNDNKASLYSTVHGAGRVMGRKVAAGSRKWRRDKATGEKKLVTIKEGKITKEMMMEWVNRMGVELRGAGTDESPQCYKRIVDVLKEHDSSIAIEHILIPMGVAMAGPDILDPYKD